MEHLFDKNDSETSSLDINISFDEVLFDKNVLTNELELFLQEIYIALMLAPNEIWGVSESLNLPKYLFNNYITTAFINDEITAFIDKHCSQAINFTYRVNSSIETDSSNNDFVYIEMIISTSNNGDIVKRFVLGK